MKLGGISSQVETVNFLLVRIVEPHITQYVNHVTLHLSVRNAPYAILPDILAHNFPTGCQKVGHSDATTASPAIFEVKTYSACTTRYTHPTTTHPAHR